VRGRKEATRDPAQQRPPGTVEIAARHRLLPLRQSDVDGICALISALNALRLVMADHAPITLLRSKELFAGGVEFLHRRDGLQTAIVSGMGLKRRLALTRHLAKQVSTTNCQIVVEKPDHSTWVSVADAFDWIEQSLELGCPVLVTLEGAISHYSVIAASTPARLVLFDSSGMSFILKRSCGLRRGYHQLPPQGLLRIAARSSG